MYYSHEWIHDLRVLPAFDLVLPGMEDEPQKSYKALAGVTVTAGDMAICAKISGTYVILGLLAPDE